MLFKIQVPVVVLAGMAAVALAIMVALAVLV
jgi:hypothetical protein